MVALSLVSSFTAPFLMGTLKSARTRIFLFSRFRSLRVKKVPMVSKNDIWLELQPQDIQHVLFVFGGSVKMVLFFLFVFPDFCLDELWRLLGVRRDKMIDVHIELREVKCGLKVVLFRPRNRNIILEQ